MSSHAGPSRITLSDHRAATRWPEVDLGQFIFDGVDLSDFQDDKGKGREADPLTDTELALRLHAEEVRSLAMFNDDRALAQSLADTWHPVETATTSRAARPRVESTIPSTAPRTNVAAWQTEATPRPAAQLPRPAHANSSSTESWGGWLRSIVFSLVSHGEKGKDRPAVSYSRPTGHTCIICQDPIHGIEIRVPCNHYYDVECAVDLFSAATRDESLFPPRCCRRTIPLTSVQAHLRPEILKLFNEKTIELGTLKRVYCADPKCSTFLGPQNEGWFTSTITCTAPGCTTRTCGRCKAKVTAGISHTCQRDAADLEVLALGRNAGWARCPGCAQMVELNMGCYHMTCRCKTQFCYLCQAIWKTCRCTQWDERRLVAAAEERVDFQLGIHNNAGHGRHEPPPPVANPRLGQRVPAPPQRHNVIHAPPPPAVPMHQQPVRQANRVHPLDDTAPWQRTLPNTSGALTPGSSTTPIAPVTRRSVYHDDVVPLPEDTSLSGPRETPNSTTRFQDSASLSHRSSKLLSRPTRPRSTISTSVDNTRSSVSATRRSVHQGIDAPALESTRKSEKASSISVGRSRPASTATELSINTARRSITTATTRRSVHDNTDTHGHPSEGVAATFRDLFASTPPLRINRAKFSHSVDRARLIREAIEELRVNHDCEHTRWRYRHGGGQCETCHDRLPIFLYRCLKCNTLACRRCRQNRL